MSIATNTRSTADILNLAPDPAQRVRSQSDAGRGLANMQALRSMALSAMRGLTRILSGNAYSQADAGASTTARYRLKRTAGGVMVDGHGFITTGADCIYAPVGDATVDSYELDGGDAELIDEPGYSLIARNVFLFADGVGKEVCIFGAKALTGGQAAPTKAQLRAVLNTVFGTDWDGANGFIAGEVLWQRKKIINYVVAGTVAEAGTFAITINGTEYEVTADGDDVAADVADKLRTAIGANEDGVTCGGTGANVLLTATAAGTTFTSSSEASGEGTLVGTIVTTGALSETIVDPASNAALLTERSAGSLWDAA